ARARPTAPPACAPPWARSRAGAMALSWSMAKAGALARSGRRLRAGAGRATQGADPAATPATPRTPLAPSRASAAPSAPTVKKLRAWARVDCGIWWPYPHARPTDQATLDALRKLGVELVPSELPDHRAGGALDASCSAAEGAAAFDDLTRSGRDAPAGELQGRYGLAHHVPARRASCPAVGVPAGPARAPPC
ncbi:MAG: hypothetical protein WKG07_24975, partial [Hymenobacter sp.]